MDILNEKNLFIGGVGLIGGFITSALGGWSTGMQTLFIFMAIEYISGIVVAAVFNKSPKSETGALLSDACFKVLCRKGMTLLIILIAHRLDLIVGANFIRDATIVAYIFNEGIAIIEHAGLMGIPIPDSIVKSLEVLKNNEKDKL